MRRTRRYGRSSRHSDLCRRWTTKTSRYSVSLVDSHHCSHLSPRSARWAMTNYLGTRCVCHRTSSRRWHSYYLRASHYFGRLHLFIPRLFSYNRRALAQ